MNTIRLELAPSGHGTKVFIDGVEQVNVRRVMLDVRPDRPPLISISYVGGSQVIEGSAEVQAIRSPPSE